MMYKTTLHLVLLVLVLLLPLAAQAENSTRTGGYTIHHNALTTDNLPPEVASTYQLQRSKNQGMLNISVLKDAADSSGTPVVADVKAVARTLFGQIRPIELREIREGEAIYYIGAFPVANREVLHFEIEVLPQGSRYPLQAHLRQEFYTK